MQDLLDDLRHALGEDSSEKISVTTFGPRVKDAIRGLTKKRVIYVTRAETATVSASNHAPEFDNFDYSYALQLDIPSGRTFDLKRGMKQGTDKTIPLTATSAVIKGEREYVHLYAHPSAML